MLLRRQAQMCGAVLNVHFSCAWVVMAPLETVLIFWNQYSNHYV